jgi:hypothetical protein
VKAGWFNPDCPLEADAIVNQWVVLMVSIRSTDETAIFWPNGQSGFISVVLHKIVLNNRERQINKLRTTFSNPISSKVLNKASKTAFARTALTIKF